MSDFHKTKQKLKEGAEWRGTINVSIDGEDMELTVRKLRDPEYEEVMGLISRDELEALREQMPTEKVEEHRELQRAEDLSDEERERLDELEAEIREESPSLFDVLSEQTFDGIRRCAKYGVEPDEEDLAHAFRERATQIEREHGIKVQTPEDIEGVLKKEMQQHIDEATNLASFQMGMEVLVETVGDEKN